METKRKIMAEIDINSPKLEIKERGKFSSLNKQEAKLILETYIQRSFSNRETKRSMKNKENKYVKVQRSVSDFSRLRHKAVKNKIPLIAKTELEEKNDVTDVTNVKKTSEKTVINNHHPAGTTILKPAKKSWFRNLLDQLFKKGENHSEQTVSVVSSVTPETDGHLTQTPRKVSMKKNSFRRTLSFKKNVSEDETKLIRPTHLPLKRTNKLSSVTQREKQKDFFYHRMSVEIEQLVNDCTTKENLDEESKDVKGTDDVIKQIVSILQKEGDAYDRKIKQDPTLSSFFRNISYNSFKQLADVYVDKEVKKRGSDDTPEDIKFAFSIHFTKQIAGIATHPVNRIMGFGNQYLQDNFTWLSHSTDNLNNAEDSDTFISPD